MELIPSVSSLPLYGIPSFAQVDWSVMARLMAKGLLTTTTPPRDNAKGAVLSRTYPSSGVQGVTSAPVEQFGKLMVETQTALSEKEAGYPDFLPTFRVTIAHLPASRRDQQIRLFSEDQASEVSTATSVLNLFVLLNAYWDFFNCSFLEHIARVFGDKSLGSKFDNYRKVLQLFCTRTTLNDFTHACINTDSNCSQVTMTIGSGWFSFSLEYIERCRRALIEKLLLTNYALRLTKVDRASRTITWSVPSAVLPDVQDAFNNTFCKEYHIKSVATGVPGVTMPLFSTPLQVQECISPQGMSTHTPEGIGSSPVTEMMGDVSAKLMVAEDPVHVSELVDGIPITVTRSRPPAMMSEPHSSISVIFLPVSPSTLHSHANLGSSTAHPNEVAIQLIQPVNFSPPAMTGPPNSQSHRTSDHECNICGKRFSAENLLRIHEGLHRAQNSMQLEAKKTSNQPSTAAGHRRKPFPCPICRKLFNHTSTLSIHLRSHSGEKPFKCQTCSRGFADQSSLVKHKRVHTGEKPYHCEYCNLSFSQSGNLHRHVKALHMQD